MQCPQCQHENREGARFCDECGSPLALNCPVCETENRPGAKFCNECGTSLATSTSVPTSTQSRQQPATQQERKPLSYTPQHLREKIHSSRAVLEGERKQVTVMFADIKGSTELIRELDPEAAQQLLDPAIHIMMDAVHQYEGTVNQVLGDGIMALFGAPLAHEDHAVRACYAALAMQNAMRDYTEAVRRTHGMNLQIRVGLNSGEVVVRTIGNDLHMDYSAVGPSTHLAARMEQLANPGAIILSDATLRLVEGFVQVKALGPVPVKGLDAPVEVFELMGASAVRRRLQASVARGLTRFVGRQAEIEMLYQALERATAGNGQVVAAVGEAGVGKSRLTYEFVQSHRTQDWRVLEGAAMSYSTATPYLPVTDMLKQYFGLERHDANRSIRAKVTGQLLTLDEGLQDAIPALLVLLDALPDDSPFLQLDPQQRRQRTLNALKRLLLRESQEQPLLLVVEDLHWIDSETQALLDSLVDSLPTARLLLVVNYRPEYRHGWGGKTYYTQLRLDPLPPASADEFLNVLVGDAADLTALKQRLIERTQGNPFFLEESVRTLVETQVLVGEPGAYRLAQAQPAVQMPPTVQAVLAARIDRLSPEEKNLLQTAAVIGTEVSHRLLQAIATLSEEVLQRCLAHLQAAEFLYEISLFPEQVYTFKHALTHEVAYGSLLLEQRRLLHGRIVDALQGFDANYLSDQIERLAHHALRGEVWDKALLYCRQAGAKAMTQSAYRQAVEHFEQALEVLPHLAEDRHTLEQAVDLRLDLRQASVALGDMTRIQAHLHAAESLAARLDDAYRMGAVATSMAHYYWLSGDSDQAIAFGQRAFALVESLEAFDLRVQINYQLGLAYIQHDDYRQAIVIFKQNVALIDGDRRHERFGLYHVPSSTSRSWLARCLTALGEFSEGIVYGEEALRIAQVTDDPFSLIASYWSLGLLYLQKGEVTRAVTSLEHGNELVQLRDVPFFTPVLFSAVGAAYALADRLGEAVPLLEQATGHYASAQRGAALFRARLALGGAYLQAGRIDAAQSLAGSMLAEWPEGKHRGYRAYTYWLLGEIARHGDPLPAEQAESDYRQALALAVELSMRPLQAHCHRGLGTLYSQTGQSEQARTELFTALELYQAMEMTFWLPETEAKLAEVEKR
ncbi:MAG: adenylate/guanylate cyclase domain-containing protein [Candidatus Tectomicrobia bacterium]